jgi:hypothetical protein
LGIGISSVHRLLEVPSKRIGVLLVPGDLAIDGRAAQYIENKIPVIATSHYQKQTLVESFGYSANHVRVVVPGVAPALSIPKQPGLRFVIDASAAGRQQLADYVEIIKALEAVGAHYIWIGAPGPAKVSKQACVGSFEPGPSLDVRALYASADVLISLSESGGATRALEMMQLGGTVIAYDHDSSQEYLAHGYNGYSVARNDVRSVVRYAKHMFANPAVVARMQRGASATASSWCTWFDQRAAMTQAVDALLASMERHAIDVVHTQAQRVDVASFVQAGAKPDDGILHRLSNVVEKVSSSKAGRAFWQRAPQLTIKTVVNKIKDAGVSTFKAKQPKQAVARSQNAQAPKSVQTHRSFANYREQPGDFSHEAPIVHFLHGFPEAFGGEGGVSDIAKHNELKRVQRTSYTGTLTIAWVFPMFGVGGGGHHNIFRCQRFLKEDFGIESVNFLYATPDSDISREKMAEELAQLAAEHYDYCGSPFILDWNQIDRFPIHMATTWASTYPILSSSESLLRAYFIQDYEPFFFARGGKEFLAQRSYDFGYFPICAGPWLPQQIGYVPGGRRAQDHCWYALAVNKDDYYLSPTEVPPELNELSAARLLASRQRKRQGVCFYVRASTERRGFEIAYMTIEVLKRRYPQIPIATVGMAAHDLATLKGCKHLGVLPVKELQKIYSEYAAYVVISFTNYSLLPAEIIACGGRVIDLKVPSNEASQGLFDPAKYQLCEPDPHKLAFEIATLTLAPQPEDTAPANQTTWQHEYAKIGNALLEQFGRGARAK